MSGEVLRGRVARLYSGGMLADVVGLGSRDGSRVNGIVVAVGLVVAVGDVVAAVDADGWVAVAVLPAGAAH